MGIFDFLKKKRTKEIPEEYKNIDLFLQDIKRKGKTPFKLEPEILKALIEIANTPNWYEKLDKEAIKNLELMFNKWQAYSKPKEQNKTVQKVGKANGFKKYWSGTQEEYEEALKNGLIDENTEVSIYYYTGSKLQMQEDGSVQEYME